MASGSMGPLDDDLEAEIAAALGGASIDELLDAAVVADDPVGAEAAAHRNGRVGKIGAVSGSDVLVELGPKDQGICPLDQFAEPPRAGQRFAFIADRFDEEESLWVLTRPGGTSRATFDTLAIGQTIEARVTGHNSGGLELSVAGQKAFMPVSHVELHHIDHLEPYLNQKLRAEIVELDLQRKRIILSRRSILQCEREVELEKAMTTLAPGTVVAGVVQKVEQYGAFIEIAPGVTGLAHVSDLSWTRIAHPDEVVKVGDKVNVQVLNIDRERQRIGLGLKQVAGDPWADAAHRYSVGDRVTGKVTRTQAFGAFVQLEPGVEGLVHVSQLAAERVRRVEDIVKVGEEVTAQVVEIDPDRRRIALSIKALHAGDASDAGEKVSSEDMDRYVAPDADARKSRAMQSLMGKFGGDGLKGGIG